MNIYQDKIKAFDHDEKNSILRFTWMEETKNMTDDDFKSSLTEYAGFVKEKKVKRLLIDVRKFLFQPKSDVGKWQEETITPMYNKAGVVKKAFLVLTPNLPKTNSPQALGQNFPTWFFDNEDKAIQWLCEEL